MRGAVGMPTFDTPAPVAVTVVLDTGRVRCVATQRRDTAVAVLPAGTSAAAIAAAEQTTIEHGAGLLTVKAPHRAILRPGGGIDVFLEVPAGSSLEVHTVRADIRTEGELGDCRFSTVTGPIHLEHVGALRVSTSGSDVVAGYVAGVVDVQGATASVRLQECAADVAVSTANGGITVVRAAGSVRAKTANGSIRVGELVRGAAELSTARGSVEIGIAAGTAAHVDARSTLGSVHNLLEVRTGPEGFAERVNVHARTWYGTITIQRAMP
ncbi:hypothetical protein Dvina_16020 [Dactylosporangium vinaceum]|uniref:DUF4097 domain-containing protein n=1 Tax=Dactylosporangium vinaceum TaxID=53362 RepID=A0ABV5M283_9ACTN|nr:hypothetical protein [Dactylosporangium vinaceum]UAB99443.1 hypothetical protein Dvina_16020 [Dactylosporangium vinaceum]